MGAEMLAVATAAPGVEVVHAADPSTEAVQRAARDHPAILIGTDPDAVVRSDAIDAIYIAAPPLHHADYAVRALDAGKAVFCEKPLAIDLDDGRAMVAAAQRSGLVNAVNFALADRHAALEVERAVRAGEAGDVRGVDIRLTFPTWPRSFQKDAHWLSQAEQGGMLREVLSHFIYLTDRLLGPLEPVLLDARRPDAGSSETSVFGLLTAGDVPVRILARADAALPETYEWELHGARRSYRLIDWGELSVSEGAAWTPIALEAERGTEATRLAEFARAVRRSEAARLPDFETALRVQTIIEAFHDGA
ncbi:Inositol 2-dehydrogenase/D-chiro-inositol 3-dehydrogenase [Baekduia alba]|nr:Inositol 2-dehydrogenase/D-chiro-inositol 3-dehydrogenase [Baekduia alba]